MIDAVKSKLWITVRPQQESMGMMRTTTVASELLEPIYNSEREHFPREPRKWHPGDSDLVHLT
jgi:hypothetical protein